jgi:type IV pilus assembly protein PilY1
MVETDGSSGLTTADRSSTVPGGGFPPTPVPVITVINGTPTQAVISGSQLLNPPSRKLGTRIPTFWHNDRDR